jgi:hypothetical protein
MQDFVPASSDYDILVVIDGVLSPEDLSVLDALHRRLLAEFPDAQRLEGDYVPRHLLVPQGTTAPVPGFYGGQFKPEIAGIMLSADNVANMRESGVAVYGPPPETVLPPVAPEHVRAAALDMLLEGPGECATEQDAATEVLNLVRCLFTLETGRPTTKSEAAAWVLSHLAQPWQAVVQRSEAVRRGEPVAEGDTQLRTALPALYQALRPLYAQERGSDRRSADEPAGGRGEDAGA